MDAEKLEYGLISLWKGSLDIEFAYQRRHDCEKIPIRRKVTLNEILTHSTYYNEFLYGFCHLLQEMFHFNIARIEGEIFVPSIRKSYLPIDFIDSVIPEHTDPTKKREYNQNCFIEKQFNNFTSICKEIIADERVDQNEAERVLQWMNENENIVEICSIKNLAQRISVMLSDSHLDNAEASELLMLLKKMT
jgi:hypothetical protein